eukprot:TRINITY_DN893_c0_g2_i1.p2 TRINITY_DN893_c0_g2~~TRINITY_DN893_c0_g2_i1.p2  ORF type:complete len:389 (+),score=88.10 TRINITY_DN893_c0_g2_i1:86-1252(+)
MAHSTWKQCLLMVILGVAALGGVLGSPPEQGFRGVNLGGWLVLESWITPSLFQQNGVAAGQGTWEFCQQLGKAKCQAALNAHYDAWLQEDDLRALSQGGITHLRIPVGYWLVDIQPDEPFVDGAWPYLERALGWCRKYNLKALIDLHGAPGSQNGNDHSGRVGPINWPQPQNVNRTISVVTTLATRLQNSTDVVFGIELINEPKTTDLNGPITFAVLKDYYLRAYASIRATGWKEDIWLADGWAYGQNDPVWNGFMAPPNYYGVYLDVHNYFEWWVPTQDPQQLLRYPCDVDRKKISSWPADWIVVGEWSLAIQWTMPTNNDYPQDWFRAQTQAYCPQCQDGGPQTPGKGWFFWNFKIESGYDEWNYLKGIQTGWMPKDAANPGGFRC